MHERVIFKVLYFIELKIDLQSYNGWSHTAHLASDALIIEVIQYSTRIAAFSTSKAGKVL